MKTGWKRRREERGLHIYYTYSAGHTLCVPPFALALRRIHLIPSRKVFDCMCCAKVVDVVMRSKCGVKTGMKRASWGIGPFREVEEQTLRAILPLYLTLLPALYIHLICAKTCGRP